jgi:hypothetical protein
MSNEEQNGFFAKPVLAVRCFSHEELQAIKTDCFHILKSVDLSETENILMHLKNEGYITDYRSYSAKES